MSIAGFRHANSWLGDAADDEPIVSCTSSYVPVLAYTSGGATLAALSSI